jgi:eukaryotic-like serine/threonine-protein kinase
MSLAPGTKLGPYDVVAPLGAGGMGEVYRARDTRLERDVAIKVLPPAFANEPDRIARFDREAKAVAALSHPNILAIHDIGTVKAAGAGAGGSAGDTAPVVTYVVTELLDGETLRARLAQGPLPTRKAIDYAVQIARGLSAAHDKGLVHRDLKPENLFLLKDGQLKILDFGLARTTAPVGGEPLTGVDMTDAGMVLGTVGYMAPEQVRGLPADGRTDLFALGAVVYEMLSGKRAFQRGTAADTLAAILNEDPPDLTASRPDFSPALDRIVRHSLEKNPNERFQSARDVAFALEALSGSGSSTAAARAMTERPRKRWLVPAIGAAAILLALVGGYGAGRRAVPIVKPASTRFETRTFDPQTISNARFAPDGLTIVFSSALSPGVSELFVIRPGSPLPQRLGQPRTHLLSVSSRGEMAVLTNASPIGQRLFTGTLARMTMDGEPRPWMEHVREADWSPDGSSLAIVRDADGRDRLEYPIGKVLYETPGYASDLRVSPDGTRVAFMDHQLKFDDRGWIKVVDRQGRVSTLAGEYWGEEGLAWSSDGATIYFSAGVVPGLESYQPMAVSTGANPTAREALSSIGAVIVQDVSRDGRWLVMRADAEASVRALVPGATAEREYPWLNNAVEPYVSADGKLLVFGDESQGAGPTYSVAMRRTDGSPAVRLGEGGSGGLSPDGRWALGGVSRPPRLAAYPTGTGDPVVLDHGPIVRYSGGVSWLPDSKRVIACGNEASKPVRCYLQSLDGGPPKPITPDGTSDARVSPDGLTIAVRFVDGTTRVWPFAGGQPRAVPGISSDDRVVDWSRDSKALLLQPPGLPARLERLDLATGKRTLIRTVEPPDHAGLLSVVFQSVLEDGKYYAVSYNRNLTTLFVVTGVR